MQDRTTHYNLLKNWAIQPQGHHTTSQKTQVFSSATAVIHSVLSRPGDMTKSYRCCSPAVAGTAPPVLRQ